MSYNERFSHRSVLLSETVDALNVRPGGIYLDCTVGWGGHSQEILNRGGDVIAVDKDRIAIDAAKTRLAAFGNRVTFAQCDYKNVEAELDRLGIGKLDGILADLGVSSPQIDDPDRGFSYMKDGALDMRMNRDGGLTAADVVNTYEESALAEIMFRYGEERYARKIARMIVEARQKKAIETTLELAELVERAYPPAARRQAGRPAKRVFQAVRIEVNGELERLREWIETVALRLKTGGRIAIISFHSLEDRAVKNAFRTLEKDCVCPPDSPVCTCGKRREVKILTKKPITASDEELKENKRSESAKLRIAERV